MVIYEVAVVGAGVHGAAAAFHLARQGVGTLILEKDFPAAGPTGRSSAICRAYYTNEFLARVAREAIGFFQSFEKNTGNGGADFVQTGALFLHPESDRDELARTVSQLNRIGTSTEFLDVEAIAARYPGIDLSGVGCGAWESEAGYADPAGTTTGLVRGAVGLGATLSTETHIVTLEEREDRVDLVSDSGEVFSARQVLLATGPWTKPLASQVGVDLPLTVERHIVATFRWGNAPRVPYLMGDLINEYYLKPESTDQFFLGPIVPEPQCNPDDFDSRISDDEAASLIGAAVARVPTLADAEHVGGWASLYDVSPDWQPIIGRISERVVVDAGTSGHGFKLAPALGRHVAMLVLDSSVDAGLEQFSPERFDAGNMLEAGWGSARILG